MYARYKVYQFSLNCNYSFLHQRGMDRQAVVVINLALLFLFFVTQRPSTANWFALKMQRKKNKISNDSYEGFRS